MYADPQAWARLFLNDFSGLQSQTTATTVATTSSNATIMWDSVTPSDNSFEQRRTAFMRGLQAEGATRQDTENLGNAPIDPVEWYLQERMNDDDAG